MTLKRERSMCMTDPAPNQKEEVTGGSKEGESSSCIWTNRDIDTFRKVQRSMEEDRGRLRSQLRDALVELRGQEDTRRQMQALLDANEQSLVKAKHDATLRAINIKALQAKDNCQASHGSRTGRTHQGGEDKSGGETVDSF